MYANEYDLQIAADRCRERQDEMKMIRLARAAQAEKLEYPGVLDRLVALTSRSLHIHTPHGKIGAAA